MGRPKEYDPLSPNPVMPKLPEVPSAGGNRPVGNPADRKLSKAQKRTIARERERTALNLRKAGASLEQIAAHMKVHSATVSKILKRALDRLTEYMMKDVEAVRTLECERLDHMLMSAWGQLNKEDLTTEGMLGIIDRVLKIQDRRAKYMGLDNAPPPSAPPNKNAQAVAGILPILKGATTDELLSFRTLMMGIQSRQAEQNKALEAPKGKKTAKNADTPELPAAQEPTQPASEPSNGTEESNI